MAGNIELYYKKIYNGCYVKCGLYIKWTNNYKIRIAIIFTGAIDSIPVHLKYDCPHKNGFITDFAEKYV